MIVLGTGRLNRESAQREGFRSVEFQTTSRGRVRRRPAATATGHLVNGAFSLPEPLQLSAGGPFAALGSGPLALRTWSGPASNDAVTVAFRQAIKATDALRTGTYAKNLTFTLSTTTP
jgi:hypothetical protein